MSTWQSDYRSVQQTDYLYLRILIEHFNGLIYHLLLRYESFDSDRASADVEESKST
jgi:hypothetical protein